MIWRWWRKRPVVVTKDLSGLSVLTDEHLEYLGTLYEREPEYGLIKSRITFGCYVELTQKNHVGGITCGQMRLRRRSQIPRLRT